MLDIILQCLDDNLLMAGQDFERLPTTYVIFVTESDVLKGGRLCYHIDLYRS